MYGALTKQQTAQTNMEGRIASMDKWISYYSSVADLGLKKLRKGNLTELLMVTLDFVCVLLQSERGNCTHADTITKIKETQIVPFLSCFFFF